MKPTTEKKIMSKEFKKSQRILDQEAEPIVEKKEAVESKMHAPGSDSSTSSTTPASVKIENKSIWAKVAQKHAEIKNRAVGRSLNRAPIKTARRPTNRGK